MVANTARPSGARCIPERIKTMRTKICPSRRLFAPLLLALLVVGCGNTLAPVQPGESASRRGTGIYPTVVVAPSNDGTTRVEIRLERVGIDSRIAGFQGELAYRAGEITIVRAELASGAAGSWYHSAPGRARFAGAALDGIGDGALVTFYVTQARAVRASDFALEIDELTSAGSFSDLTALVVAPKDRSLSTGSLR